MIMGSVLPEGQVEPAEVVDRRWLPDPALGRSRAPASPAAVAVRPRELPGVERTPHFGPGQHGTVYELSASEPARKPIDEPSQVARTDLLRERFQRRSL